MKLPMPLPDSIARKIVAVEGEDRAQLQTLGENDERGVGEIHRMVGISDHQFEGPDQGGVVQEPDIETVPCHEVHQAPRADAATLCSIKDEMSA